MERRKFMIGAGALATGSAAAVGTGAFTSVEAERDFALATAGDAAAFLTITVEDPEHAGVTDNDIVELAFDGDATGASASGADGDGINKNATTRFDEVISIQNQGTEEVELFFVTDEEDVDAGRADRTNVFDDNGDDLTAPAHNSRTLGTGESTTIDFQFETGEGTRIGEFVSNKLIVAQQDAPTDSDFVGDVRDDVDPYQGSE
ncbi:hypothetical protein [Halorubrum tibetense]|uniref:DUF1102 domain-containing protein n=1 Tax=Halorubrum tibetense TaxID=175631 RepID=A0ABD5SA95_9EURY